MKKGPGRTASGFVDAIASNQPYDDFVREILTSVGSTFQTPASNYFRVNDDPKIAMETTTQVFLGVRMVCAQCATITPLKSGRRISTTNSQRSSQPSV